MNDREIIDVPVHEPINALSTSGASTPAPPRRSRSWLDPSRHRRAWATALFAVVVLLLCLLGNGYHLYLGGLVIIFALSVIGLDWLMGRTGQVSIGNGALMAVGAYTTAIVADNSWARFPIPLIVAALVGAAAGLIIGLPSLRLSGIYFALTTLALQFIVQFAASEYEGRTGQLSGLTVPPLTLFGYEFTYGVPYVLLLSAILGLTLLLLSNMFVRLPGRMWLATKESELAAATIRVDVRRWKLVSFVGSSALIAMSGSLYAYYAGNVSSETFTLTFATTFIVMNIVGGVSSMAGAILGAALVTLAPQFLTNLSNKLPNSGWLASNLPSINNGLYGLLVLLILLYLPRGLVPSIQDGLTALTRRTLGRPSGAAAPTDYQEPSAQELRPQPPLVSKPAVVEEPDARKADNPLLDIRGLYVTYANGAKALNGVNLQMTEAATVAVVGRNGAGKSTLLRSVSGFFATERVQRSGTVRFAGGELIGANPVRSASLGVVLVPERDKVFPSLSVGEHLRHLGNPSVAESQLPEVWALLEKRWKSPAGLLSGGERQLLAITVAASLEPRLIMIDEMSLGLAPVMIDRVVEVLEALRRSTTISLLIVEQNIAVADRLADHVLYLRDGQFDTSSASTSAAREEV